MLVCACARASVNACEREKDREKERNNSWKKYRYKRDSYYLLYCFSKKQLSRKIVLVQLMEKVQ